MTTVLLTDDRLLEIIRGYRREVMPTFWTIAEEDPGGYLGGGGPTYLSDGHNPYHSCGAWVKYDAAKFPTREEAESSEAWKALGPYAPKFWIEEVKDLPYKYPRLTEDEIHALATEVDEFRKNFGGVWL